MRSLSVLVRFFLICIVGLGGFACGGNGPVIPGDGHGQAGWAKSWGTEGPDYAWKVATDGNGGIYVAGAVEPGKSDDMSGGSNSSTQSGAWDCFLAKWNSKGELVWYRVWGGPAWDWCRSVAVELSGNVYVSGEFSGAVDFDPGPGIDLRTSSGSWDAFLAKFKSDGSYLWSRTWGGENWEEALDISIDPSGYVYMVGSVSGSVDFDPGPGVDLHDANYLPDAFLVKYSPDGEYRWGRHWGSVGWDWATGVDASSPGAVFVCGSFSNTCDFDQGDGVVSRTSSGGEDAHLVKYDDLGNLKWVRTWGGPLWDEALEVCVDEAGNPYVTGFCEEIIDFDPGPDAELHGIDGLRSGYVTGYDASGSHRWAESWGVGSLNYAYALDSDRHGHLFVTGYFSNSLIFDQESAHNSLASVGGTDVYSIGLDTSGNVEWSRRWGGYWDDYGLGVVSDRSGSLYICGVFDKGADLDPGPDTLKFISKGKMDTWLIRMKADGTW
jgi:hypothetical protein